MKVVIQKDLFERSLEVFSNAEKTYGIQFIQTEILDENTMLKQHTSGINCFVIGAEKYSRNFYNSLKNGTAVIRYGVGYNAVPIDICIQKNIKVAFTPGTLTDSVAEHTFALLLCIVRKLQELHQSVKSGNWKGLTGLELKNKTMALIGYGQIGQAVAKIAKLGFGMKVVAYDIKKMKSDDLLDNYSNDFKSIVKNADIVSLHLATVPETLGFINEERIDMLKDGSILINTARGELVVEKELHKALKNGKIKAAGLDVFENEPYHPNSEVDFRKLDNIVLTPHCGSNTTEASNRMAELVVRNILAYYSSKDMILIPEIKDNLQIRKH